MKRYHPKQPKPRTLRLKENHSWKAPPGHKIVVIDRGIASFNIPESWVVTDTKPFTLRDKPVPDDRAGIQVTTFTLPPRVDWSGLPLAPMLANATKDTNQELIFRSEIATYPRSDIELVWMQDRFVDPKERREAYTRNALARGFDVQILITFSYWVEDALWCLPVWDEVLRSLQLGRRIENPLSGPLLH